MISHFALFNGWEFAAIALGIVAMFYSYRWVSRRGDGSPGDGAGVREPKPSPPPKLSGKQAQAIPGATE